MVELKLLLLVILANGAPIVVDDLLRHRPGLAIDFGARLPDGQPLFGSSKTWRGLFGGVLLSTAGAWLVGIDVLAGALIGSAAMAGDLASSFIKRRLRRPVSSMAPGLDQIPESLLPLLAVQPLYPLPPPTLVVLVTAFIAIEIVLSRLLFKLHLRQRPY